MFYRCSLPHSRKTQSQNQEVPGKEQRTTIDNMTDILYDFSNRSLCRVLIVHYEHANTRHTYWPLHHNIVIVNYGHFFVVFPKL